MDPLTNVRRRLALLTSEGRVMSFFDNDILNAIQTREKNYVERMTNIFTSQFKNKYSSLVNELETEQKRVAVMDRQMDLLRSACDRRRQENNNQRRAFLLEIIGLKQSKDRTSQMRLNALLHKLEEGGSLGSEAETIDMDDFNDIEMNGGSRKQAKMIKDQHKEIMRYKERVKSLNQDVASGAKFAKQLKSERKRLREAVETMQGQLEEATTANSGFQLKIEQLKLANRGANKELDKLLKRDGPDWWGDGAESASRNRTLLENALAALSSLGKDEEKHYDLDGKLYGALEHFLGGEKMWKYLTPNLVSRYTELLQVPESEREASDAHIHQLFKVVQTLYRHTEAHHSTKKEIENLNAQLKTLENSSTTQEEMIQSLEHRNKYMEDKLKGFEKEKSAAAFKKTKIKAQGTQADTLGPELSALTKKATELESENAKLEKRLGVFRAEHTHDAGNEKGLKKQIKVLMDELEYRRADIEELQSEAMLYREEIHSLQSSEANFKHEVKDLKEEINRLVVEHHGGGAQGPRALAADPHQVARLRDEVQELKMKVKQCIDRKVYFEKKAGRLSDEIRRLKEKLSEPEERAETKDQASGSDQPYTDAQAVGPGDEDLETEMSGNWGWLATTLKEMVTEGYRPMPVTLPLMHDYISSTVLKGGEEDKPEEGDEGMGPAAAGGDDLGTVPNDNQLDGLALDAPESEADCASLTPEVLSQALTARKWLIAQQARMNWAVLTRKAMNTAFRFRIGKLNDVLTEYQAEAKLEIHERLLKKGQRRLSRLEIHRTEVARNRRRATEQVLSAASYLAMSPARRPRNIVRNEFPAFEGGMQAYRPQLAANTINIGMIPETQRAETEHFRPEPVHTIPHTSMGYFPARNMRMEKKKPEAVAPAPKRAEKRRRRRKRKAYRPPSDNPKHNSYRNGANWVKRDEESARGKLVKRVLRDIETTPTFAEEVVHRNKVVDPVVLAGCHPAKSTNPERVPKRPTSARGTKICTGPMFREMAPRPQTARSLTYRERARNIDMALMPTAGASRKTKW